MRGGRDSGSLMLRSPPKVGVSEHEAADPSRPPPSFETRPSWGGARPPPSRHSLRSFLRTRAGLEPRAAPQDEGGQAMSDGAYLYILRCVDGSYYTGTARSGLEQRVAEHNAGTYGGYTAQ